MTIKRVHKRVTGSFVGDYNSHTYCKRIAKTRDTRSKWTDEINCDNCKLKREKSRSRTRDTHGGGPENTP